MQICLDNYANFWKFVCLDHYAKSADESQRDVEEFAESSRKRNDLPNAFGGRSRLHPDRRRAVGAAHPATPPIARRRHPAADFDAHLPVKNSHGFGSDATGESSRVAASKFDEIVSSVRVLHRTVSNSIGAAADEVALQVSHWWLQLINWYHQLISMISMVISDISDINGYQWYQRYQLLSVIS